MATIAWLLLFTLAVGSLFYFRISLVNWAITTVVLLSLWIWVDADSRLLQTLTVFIALAGFIPLLNRPLRRKLISDKLFGFFKSVMPPMSETERDALEAGTVWWDGELFSGAPNWSTLLAYKKPELSDEESEFLNGPVEQLCNQLNDWEITHVHQEMPSEVWQFMKDKGFFGMIIPRHYGGLGFSALAHSQVVMKLASRSATAAVTVMVPNSLGPAELLLRYGTDEQKDYYLPRLAKGDEIPCFALTGPEAGSDASAMPDHGIVCRGEFEGRTGVLGIKLNWEKRYITLGPVATLLGLAFKLYDPDHLLGSREDIGITVALIPTNTAGIEIGRRHFPMNIAFQNGPNKGTDVFIPIKYLLGGQDKAGQGWRMLMECLAAGRSISLPALSTGAGKLVSRATGAYARIRRQFKMPIGYFEGVEEPLARIAALTYMMDAVRTMTAGAVDEGQQPAVISAIAKYQLTETMRQLINDAMDIQGGSAICMGPRNYLARSYQSIPISITVEGANILTRSLIIFGQGAIRCHPYVLKEMQAVKNNNTEQGLVDFDEALFQHAGFTLSNMARTLFLGLTHAKLVKKPVSGEIARYYQHLTRMSAAFALVSDMSILVLGGSLKRKEKLSGRLADIASYLYLASATLKRFEDDRQPREDLVMVQWVCDYCLFKIQEAMMGLLRNYPIRLLAHALRILVFPFGQTFRQPDDRLGQKVARILLSPSAARDRLTDGIHMPTELTQVIGRLDAALYKVITAEPAERKLRAAQKKQLVDHGTSELVLKQAVERDILTSKEVELILLAESARNDVIAVDDFPQDLGLPGQSGVALGPKTGNKYKQPEKGADNSTNIVNMERKGKP